MPQFFLEKVEIRSSKEEKTTLGALVSDINTTNNKKRTAVALFISSSFTGKTSYICNIAHVLVCFKIKGRTFLSALLFVLNFFSYNAKIFYLHSFQLISEEITKLIYSNFSSFLAYFTKNDGHFCPLFLLKKIKYNTLLQFIKGYC